MRVDSTRSLLVYGGAHALTDAICAAAVIAASLALLASGGASGGYVLSLALAYNFLAFAGQLPLGMLLDRLRTPRTFAGVGLMLCAAALQFAHVLPEMVVILCGVGNALFHLGGGAVALTLAPGKAGPPGVFVAPGAVGLFLGFRLGMQGVSGNAATIIFVAAACLAGTMAFLPLPAGYARRDRKNPKEITQTENEPVSKGMLFALAAAMCSIVIRSYVGLTLDFPWKETGFAFACALVVAGACGKAAGGLLADCFGFARLSCGALLCAIPLLFLSRTSVVAGLAGSLCFQMTMAVTLLACLRVFPGREGTAFGLNCIALFVGSLPLLLPFREVVNMFQPLRVPVVQAALVFVSLLCLGWGLRRLWSGGR